MILYALFEPKSGSGSSTQVRVICVAVGIACYRGQVSPVEDMAVGLCMQVPTETVALP